MKKNKFIGKIGGHSYAIKIDGVDSTFPSSPFRRQLNELSKIKKWKESAKVAHIGAKHKSTLAAIRAWVKENNPAEYYAKWQSDSKCYKNDSVELFYKIMYKESTWRDPDTNLIWQKEIAHKEFTWEEAIEHVKKLNKEKHEGHSDWRLPSRDELKSLMTKTQNTASNRRRYYIKEPLVESVSFDEWAWFWSATDDNIYACAVDFRVGEDYFFGKPYKKVCAMCVRDELKKTKKRI